MTVQFTLADAPADGVRADHALRARFPAVPRAFALTLLKTGRILVDGTPARLGTKLSEGSVVTVDIARERLGEEAAAPRARPAPPTVPFTLVHRAPAAGFASLVVVDKAAGLAMHEGTGVEDDEDAEVGVRPLAGLIRDQFAATPSFLGRLDRPTSGLVVCALDDEALATVLPPWQSGDVHKEYLALVHAGRHLKDNGVIDAPLAARRPRQKGRGIVEDARTAYRVLARGDGRALLLCELFSGRTHQIRRHLKSARHPIVGDPRYGARDDDGSVGLMLHAWRLRRRAGAQRWPHALLPDELMAACPPRLRQQCVAAQIDVDDALARA